MARGRLSLYRNTIPEKPMTVTMDVLAAIQEHGEETYPEECCGFLIGRIGEDGNEVMTMTRVPNRDATRRHDRYVITPEDYRNADRAATEQGLDIVGIYHSHPDHPARPSATDLGQATFPGYTYVIVSIRGGNSAEITAWTLAPDRSRFLPEAIVEAAPRPL